MELTEEVKELLIKTAKELQGSACRLFMARTVRALGTGGQRRAEKVLGWDRGLIRKGEHELKSGIVCADAFNQRGRKRSEEHLPNLLKDIIALVDGQSQADPQFRSTRLYTRLTAVEVRRQLITTYHYTDVELPTTATITTKLNELGYTLKKVAKAQPQKKSQKPMPSSITLKEVNAIADAEDSSLRLSMEAKAMVKVGPFARGGKNRVLTKAADHDFEAQATVTPVGIFLPALDEFFLYGVTSKVTSDCLVDRLTQWWESVKKRFSQIKTLVINLDNGPENHSHRTQFMQRLLEFAQNYQITIRLAYYPPYHSKYNTVERCWGILEHHWNGALLDSVEAVIRFAQTMTWKGKHPMVDLVTSVYKTGVKLSKEAMHVVEAHLQRWASLEKWFVDIPSSLPTKIQMESRSALQEKSTSQKRPRGRPRTKPLPDPNQPKRPRGRPPKPVLTESITLIATPG